MPELEEILTDLEDGLDGEKINLGNVIEKFQDRGFGPLLLAPALIAILPTGAIPGVPAICAIVIILVSLQMMMGRAHPWLPSKVKSLSISRKSLDSAVDKAMPWAKRIDRFISSRLEFLTRDTATRITGIVAIILALIMIPLELIPFACAIPGASLAFLALGLSAKDGLVMLIGLISTVGSAYAIYNWWGNLWPF